jgi:hypothetical protein
MLKATAVNMHLRAIFSSCSPHIVKYQIALPPEVADALRFGLENFPSDPTVRLPSWNPRQCS